MFCVGSENKVTDQLHGYCAADLRLCFLHLQNAGFLMTRRICNSARENLLYDCMQTTNVQMSQHSVCIQIRSLFTVKLLNFGRQSCNSNRGQTVGYFVKKIQME